LNFMLSQKGNELWARGTHQAAVVASLDEESFPQTQRPSYLRSLPLLKIKVAPHDLEVTPLWMELLKNFRANRPTSGLNAGN
jgi:hypothetical protein